MYWIYVKNVGQRADLQEAEDGYDNGTIIETNNWKFQIERNMTNIIELMQQNKLLELFINKL